MSVKAHQSPELRAAIYLFKLLGRPKNLERRINTDWVASMRQCLVLSGLTIDEMGAFLKWVVVDNQFSHDYMRIAADPMATFQKNLDGNLARWRADYVDPDPLTEKRKTVDGDEMTLILRKPKSVGERKTLLKFLWSRSGKANPTVQQFLAQDLCPRCLGHGGNKAKLYPHLKGMRWMEQFVICECVTMEEML